MIAFTPHTTNGAMVTLNVDGLGAKPLRAQPSVDLQSGVLIQGTPYAAVYNNSDGAFYLYGVGTNPGIPLGSSIDYWGASAPTSSFALAYGRRSRERPTPACFPCWARLMGLVTAQPHLTFPTFAVALLPARMIWAGQRLEC
ncbi:hypothetical protein [Bradyrhizobium sp. S3.9.1]|uniref:hypothetical protein n=1 Tax=Bradyrhizobium sp. S3.9.1 TaxID=3156431 RepID=UPI0033915910